MAIVKFKKGLHAALPELLEEGTLYFVTDEHAIYYDVDGENRVRMDGIVEVDSLDALNQIDPPLTSALYYVKDINALAKHNGEEWEQINPDTGMIHVTTDGAGNAVTGADYSDSTRTLTLHKTGTYVDSAGVESAISAKIGDISEDTVKEYIDNKTANLSSDETRLGELETKVNKNTADIGTLNGEDSVDGSVKAQIKAAKDELNATITGLDSKYALKDHTHSYTEITGLSDELSKKADQTELQSIQEKIAGLTGAMHFKGVVEEDPTSLSDKAGYASGDVVYFGEKEYVFIDDDTHEGGAFVELGDTTALGQQYTTLSGKVDGIDKKLAGISTTVTDYVTSQLEGKLEESDLAEYAKKTEIEEAKNALIGTDAEVTAATIKAAVKEAIEKANKALEWGEF